MKKNWMLFSKCCIHKISTAVLCSRKPRGSGFNIWITLYFLLVCRWQCQETGGLWPESLMTMPGIIIFQLQSSTLNLQDKVSFVAFSFRMAQKLCYITELWHTAIHENNLSSFPGLNIIPMDPFFFPFIHTIAQAYLSNIY